MFLSLLDYACLSRKVELDYGVVEPVFMLQFSIVELFLSFYSFYGALVDKEVAF